jgi:transposase
MSKRPNSRRAHGLFQNATAKGQIEHTPDFNVPSKLFKNSEMTPILHELVTLSALPVAGLENDFSVDSTGFRTTTFNAYNGMKHGQKKEHQGVKAHLCAGVTINEVSADMAYSSRLNLQLVANEGGKAYIPYRKNATGKSRGSSLWSKMYHYFQINRDDFMEHYLKRSNIEATNAAIKRKFGETLKSKNPTAQMNELLAKIIAYNLTVTIHEMHENGINPDFLYPPNV